MKNKVYIGFSGGVDSSVSAYLLKEQGFDVKAVFIDSLSPRTCAGKCAQRDLKRARDVSKSLGIDLVVWNFRDLFKDEVIDKFLEDYSNGETPNPCIECNKLFKFGLFAKKAFEEGAEYIATGHYCIARNDRLYKGVDPNKDQSYFLNRVKSEVLERTMFPIGHMYKSEVREIAESIGLSNSKKRDSQEICFLQDTSLEEFLSKKLNSKKGEIRDTDSDEVVGEHDGIFKYTLGQRKGIKVGGSREPYFVSKKDVGKNILYVAKGREHPSLWKRVFVVEDFNFINSKNNGSRFFNKAVIRYHSKEVPVIVRWKKTGRGYKGVFHLRKKVWTPSVGQSLVLYKRDECLGGGKITEIL